MGKLDSGVAVVLGGEERMLQPTLKAAKAISRRFGDLNKAIGRVMACDVDAQVFVAAAGLNVSETSIEETVFRAGFANIIPALVRYLAVLANGGRNVDDDGEARADPKPGEG